MANIMNSGEQRFIRKIVAANGNMHWIGALRVGQNKLFWYNNIEDRDPPTILTEFSYSHWNSGQPDDVSEGCVAFHPDGHWYDYNCDNYDWYAVCELRC